MIDSNLLKLYLVTDNKQLNGRDFFDVLEEALKGGVTLVQIREKDISSIDYYNKALKVRELTKKYNVPFIVNDRVDIALAVGADGVHIGQNDLPLKEVRKIARDKLIIGVTANNLDLAKKAEYEGADYIGSGAIFNTNTKTDVDKIAKEELINIIENINIPVCAIGGINIDNILELNVFKDKGLKGIAVSSGIMGVNNVFEISKSLLKFWNF